VKVHYRQFGSNLAEFRDKELGLAERNPQV
jgi:hypothetical protein